MEKDITFFCCAGTDSSCGIIFAFFFFFFFLTTPLLYVFVILLFRDLFDGLFFLSLFLRFSSHVARFLLLLLLVVFSYIYIYITHCYVMSCQSLLTLVYYHFYASFFFFLIGQASPNVRTCRVGWEGSLAYH
jgi:hypothetical protein